MSDELCELDLAEIQTAYGRRELSPRELIASSAARIEATEPLLNAYVTLCLDRAAGEAAEAERRLAAGTGRLLEGIPFAVKDLFDTEGVRTTYGSRIYADHVPSADAEAVRLVREAGGILVGKTATHEFAWGITTENPHLGPCRNPWDTDRVSGGSSGGSAAALASGSVPMALGTDTGGSIRIPSAFCGVVGLKPTFGRVSAVGVMPLVESMDHVGPMARTPAGAAQLLNVLSRGQFGDLTSAGPGSPGHDGLAGLRIGISGDLNGAEPTAAVARVVSEAVETCEGLGATVSELSFSKTGRIAPTFATIQRVEALLEHRRRGIFPQRAAEYGEDVRGRLEAGIELGIDDYLRSTVERAAISGELVGLLSDVDLLLTPVAAGPPKLVNRPYFHHGDEVDFRTVAMSSTMGQNLAGVPACALRGGFDELGLPVAIQLTGRHGAEARVLAAAEAFVAATTEVQARRPQLAVEPSA